MNRYEIPSKFDFINVSDENKETLKTAGIYVGAAVVAIGVIYAGYKIGGMIGGYVGGKVGEMVDNAFAESFAAGENSTPNGK